ncbi:LPXTG cell wall anchor domain-containing protein [Corynebacterium sp. CCUG 60159]|nr:LPXTG cell wall anchor domain-containing protein [Corynebacterium pseudogenitalium]
MALAAGLGAYPAVQAEETTTVSDITTDDAGLPTYSWMDDDTSSSSATPSAPAAASASNPASASASKPAEAPATANPVTVERKGDVDRIVVNDPDGEAWEFGGKASKENIFALQREGKGEIKEVLSVTADGRKLEPYDYGFVNTKDGSFVAFNLNALHTIPPVDVEIEVRTTDAGEYAIAESDEVPSEAELAESGYGEGRPAEAADASVGQNRAATIPGYPDAELNVSGLNTEWVNNNPQLTFKIGGTEKIYRMTRFAVKKTRNDSNTKNIEGPVSIRIQRDGVSIAQLQYGFTTVGVGDNPDKLNQRFWNKNALGKSYDTEFRLVPEVKDLEVKPGDVITMSLVGPPNGEYAVQAWGQPIDAPEKVSFVMKPEDKENAIPLSKSETTGNSPYRTTSIVEADSTFKRAVIEVKAPNSFLAKEYYSFHIDLLEEGVTFERKVIETNSGFVKMEIYPVKNGKRVEDGVFIPKGAQITSTASFSDQPSEINAVTIVEGTVQPKESNPERETLPDSGDWLPQRVPNPEVPKKCGLKIAIVADLSRSLKYADLDPDKNNGDIGFAQSREAATAMVDALKGTSTRVGIYNFARTRGTRAGTTGDAVSMMTDRGVETAKAAINEWTIGNTPGDATNWEDGLAQLHGQHYDLVYFITDGVPTWDNGGWQNPNMENTGAFLQATSVKRAVESANQLKLEGTRIVPIMVTLTLGADRKPNGQEAPNFVYNQDYVLKDVLPWNDGVAKQELEKNKIYFKRTSVNINDRRSSMYNTKKANIVVNFQRSFDVKPPIYNIFSIDDRGVSRDISSKQDQWAYGPRTVDQLAKDISGDDAPVRIENYYALSNQLGDRAKKIKELCEGELIVKKRLVDSSGYVVENGDGAPGWTFVANADQSVLDPGDGALTKTDTKVTVKEDSKFNAVDPELSVKKGTVKWRLAPTNAETGAMGQTGLTVIESLDQKSGYRIYQRDMKNAVCTQEVDGKKYGAEVVNNGETGFDIVAAPYSKVYCTVDNTQSNKYGLTLTKVDASDNAMSLTGAGFTLSWAEQDGTPKSLPLTEEKESAGTYTTDKVLELGRTYVLTETKAPKAADGAQYSLLAQPVTLRFVSTQQGLVPEFQGPNGTWLRGQPALPIVSASVDKDKTNMILTLANVRQGNLPKTGGAGLQLPIVLGGVLIAAGALMGRRRVVA